MTKEDKKEIDKILFPIKNHKKVKQMKNYCQHGRISTYDHCCHVAALSYSINKKLHLGGDVRTILTGAMLHDFYLYDWHADDGGTHNWHGYIHAGRALKNAQTYFSIDKKTQEVIRCHMWPLNLFSIPKSREAWIVCAADKWVSLQETLFMRRKKT